MISQRGPAARRARERYRTSALLVTVLVVAVLATSALLESFEGAKTSVPTAHARPDLGRVPAGHIPPLLDPRNVYAADAANRLAPAVRGDRPLVYVPNSQANTVDEIDPLTLRPCAGSPSGRCLSTWCPPTT